MNARVYLPPVTLAVITATYGYLIQFTARNLKAILTNRVLFIFAFHIHNYFVIAAL
jgi:hypothetical protein